MKTTRIKKGFYTTDKGLTIEKMGKEWKIKNEVTGEIYYTAKTKKDAVNEAMYI